MRILRELDEARENFKKALYTFRQGPQQTISVWRRQGNSGDQLMFFKNGIPLIDGLAVTQEAISGVGLLGLYPENLGWRTDSKLMEHPISQMLKTHWDNSGRTPLLEQHLAEFLRMYIRLTSTYIDVTLPNAFALYVYEHR